MIGACWSACLPSSRRWCLPCSSPMSDSKTFVSASHPGSASREEFSISSARRSRQTAARAVGRRRCLSLSRRPLSHPRSLSSLTGRKLCQVREGAGRRRIDSSKRSLSSHRDAETTISRESLTQRKDSSKALEHLCFSLSRGKFCLRFTIPSLYASR